MDSVYWVYVAVSGIAAITGCIYVLRLCVARHTQEIATQTPVHIIICEIQNPLPITLTHTVQTSDYERVSFGPMKQNGFNSVKTTGE